MIVIRCDSSNTLGSGHLVRCHALAQTFLKLGKRVTLFAKDLPGAHWYLISKDIRIVRMPAELDVEKDARFCLDWLKNYNANPELIIVDHYNLNAEWESHFYTDTSVFVIDDLADRKHRCHYLLDNGKLSEVNAYQKLVPESCKFFLGPKYSILRDEFINAESKELQKIKDVFVFFGGSDATLETLRFLKSLENTSSQLFFHIVVSKGNNALEEIKKINGNGYQIYIDPKVSEIMQRCDVYLGSGGTITWERMYLGLTGFVVSVAQNQEAMASDLSNQKFQIYLGKAQEVDYSTAIKKIESFEIEILKDMSERCKKLIGYLDVPFWSEIIKLDSLVIRDAQERDIQFLFELRNDDLVRAMSINENKIPYDNHVKWVMEFLKKKDSKLYIAEMNGVPIGQFRIDSNGETSISLSTEGRGKGLSSQIIKQSLIQYLESNSEKSIFYATIKKNNQASKASFSKAGFECESEFEDNGQKYFKMKYSKK